MRKPLPKRSYDLTPEELEESVRADVKKQLAPKRHMRKEVIAPGKVAQFLKNLSTGPARPPILRDDYDRTIEKLIRERNLQENEACRQKREQQQMAAKKAQQEKEAAFRQKREANKKSGKQVAQLGEQANQSVPAFKVVSDKEIQQDTIRIENPKEYMYAWTYAYGKPLVRPEMVKSLPTQLRRLHEWYEGAVKKHHEYFHVSYKKDHYLEDNAMYVPFDEIFQLFNQDSLDKAIISCYCL